MSNALPFVSCSDSDIHDVLSEVALGPITGALSAAAPMQRLRVTSLPAPVMAKVCASLQGDERWVARLLADGTQDQPWKASATKIIELRNTLDVPLLVFIPSGLRTAAEDSLDIATFSELSLASLTRQVADFLTTQLPEEAQSAARGAIEYLRLQRVIRHADEENEYLLTIRKNGSTPLSVGRSLFVFRLIPDDDLTSPENLQRRLSLNLRASEELANIQRPLRERIAKLPIRPGGSQNDLFIFLRSRLTDSSRQWAKEIACDPSLTHLNFANWQFNEGDDQKLRLVLEPLELPVQAPDAVGGAAQMKVLDLSGKQGLKISVRSYPKPAEVPVWKSFRVQLLAIGEEGPSIAWESNSYTKPTGRNQKFTRTIKLSEIGALDEGTYYAKVEAYDQNGALLTDRHPVDPLKPEGRAENESDYFLITSGVDPGEIDIPQPRLTRVPSLVDAFFLITGRQATAKNVEELGTLSELTGAWNQPIGATLRGDVFFELEGVAWRGFGVVIPSVFRRLELSILDHPEQLGLLRIDCVPARDAADLQVERRTLPTLPDWPELQTFLETRAAVFASIRKQHLVRSGQNEQDSTRAGIVETADLLAIAGEIVSYSKAFLALSNRFLKSESGFRAYPGAIAALSQLDTVELVWRRAIGDPGRALLMSPTHPLRLTWHLQHALTCQHAINLVGEGHKVPSWTEYLGQLRSEISPANLPLVLFDSRGRGYLDQGALTPFWSVYLPEGTNGERGMDVSGCRDRVRQMLGIRNSESAATALNHRLIASRALDYLEQHPYVEQLRINVFNPGDGQLIADALRLIEREQGARSVQPTTGLLRYSIQMFGQGEAHLSGMGDALDSLLDPERQAAEGDEFTLSTTNHLLPKLIFARNTVSDFLKSPGEYPAHITLFLEHFNARSRLTQIDSFGRGSFLGGLIQEPEIVLDRGDERFTWSKGIRPSPSRTPFSHESELCEGHSCVQRLQAATAAGQPQSEEIAPVVSLHLDAAALSLLKHSHEVSDWVITIDRHLGVEYFDSGKSSEEFGYLLDFSPATLQVNHPRLMLSTRSGAELVGLLQPVFDRLGWPMSPCRAEAVLEALRSLSGRLAFRLLGSTHHTDEIAGLLLARWLLGRAGLLADSVIIPLDAHQEWFRKSASDSVDAPLSRHRADLLLVGFDPATSTVQMTVVEVKLRGALTTTERGFLYRQMQEQAANTINWLRQHFDPELYAEPRADVALCAKELATTLAFYIHRGKRYGLIDESIAAQALAFVDGFDAGYRLDTRSVGVVFEQATNGAHVDEDEPGFNVHRFGADIADSLFKENTKHCDKPTGSSSKSDESTEGPTVEASPEESSLPSASPELDSLRSELGGTSRLAKSATIKPKAFQPPKDAPHHEYSENKSAAAPESIPQNDEPPTEKKPAPPAAKESEPMQPASPAASVQSSPQLPPPAVLLGANEATSQYGIIGRFGDAKVAVDLTGCNTISLFGVQGFGKSYTLGVIAEMATQAVAGINSLPSPLATVIFHYHKSDAYAPEFATAIAPNRKPREIEALLEGYGARPQGLRDVVVLVPSAKLEQRQREFPGLKVLPIQFNSGELGAESWKFLLGAYGNDSLYVRQLVAIMRRHRQGLRLETFEQEIRDADLTPGTRRLAEDRINLARPYINDESNLSAILRPGRTVIVDLRDEWIEKEEALGLFVVMMRIFAAARFEAKQFNKLVMFDEAHKYITESELIGQVVETIREMRHQATSVVIASQDPLSVPRAVVELTSILVLHRLTSPQWLKHLKSAIMSLESIPDGVLSSLPPGEALVWAQRATDRRFTQRPQKVVIRPRFSQHGGGTKTAIEGETVR